MFRASLPARVGAILAPLSVSPSLRGPGVHPGTWFPDSSVTLCGARSLRLLVSRRAGLTPVPSPGGPFRVATRPWGPAAITGHMMRIRAAKFVAEWATRFAESVNVPRSNDPITSGSQRVLPRARSGATDRNFQAWLTWPAWETALDSPEAISTGPCARTISGVHRRRRSRAYCRKYGRSAGRHPALLEGCRIRTE